VTAAVVFASSFQVNALVPSGLSSATHTLTIHSAYGAAQQAVAVSSVAPAIFVVASPNVGALVNPDGTLNGPSNPITAGQTLLVYATGLGAVNAQGSYSVATSPVTVVLNGQEIPVAFAGFAPGFPGVYQINVTIPSSTPPTLVGSLALKQGGQTRASLNGKCNELASAPSCVEGKEFRLTRSGQSVTNIFTASVSNCVQFCFRVSQAQKTRI
jgi:uncharacterized protein (TIGR03437 family)